LFKSFIDNIYLQDTVVLANDLLKVFMSTTCISNSSLPLLNELPELP